MTSYKQRHATWQKKLFNSFLLPLFIFGVLSVNLSVFSPVKTASAATASTLNFQGRLLNSAGSLVSDGSYNIEFKIYDDALAGTNHWTETRSGGSAVTIQNGYFSVYLGDVNPFGAGIPWDQDLWMTMNINGDGEMTPRFKLTAVPYAFRAGALVDASGNAKTADDFAQLSPASIQTLNTAIAALRLNQTGAGSLIQLQGNGSDVFTVAKDGSVLAAGTLTTNGTLFTNAGATLNGVSALANFGADGPIGTAAATVDVKTAFTIPQTTAGRALTLPSPTVTTAGRLVYVANTGSASFTLGGTTINAGTSAVFIWNGTAWSLAGGGSGASVTLQQAYDNAVGGIITVNATDGAFRVRDAAVTFANGSVFSVQNNAGTVDYLAVQGDGDVAFDTNTLFVDATNNRVGIGTATPAAVLQVTNAAPASVAGATGTAQIAVGNFAGGIGGSTTIATTGTGGTGGGFTYLGGTGGTATLAATASTGGAGGATSLTSGSGGAASVAGTGSNAGGAGGTFALQAGAGGNATGATSGTNTGGAGGAFTLQAGTGGSATTGSGNLVGGAGGALTLSGGTGGVGSTSGGNGGAVTLQGGTAAAMAGAAGGSATVSGRAGSATGSGGAGGALSLTAGSAGGDNTVNRAGGNVTISAGASRGASAGGTITVTAGSAGSNLTVAASVTGAASGGITFNAGSGGIAPNATTLSTGGAAGGFTVSGGTGGAASVAGAVNNTGGSGGTSAFTGGTGGIANGATTGINTGGAGGAFTFQGGTGGAATTGTGSLIGGTGGALTFSGGTGGLGTTSGGNGGGITIQGGQAAAMAGAAGGAVSISGRAGSTTGTGGNGGALTLSAGAAGGNGTVARTGGSISLVAGASNGGAAGGAVTLTAGAGGNNATAGTASGGNAGGITFNGSNGGTAPNATVSSTGGTAGGFTVNGGTGGNAAVAGTGNNTGGNGGAFVLGAGTGGNATGATTGINTGGTGGTLALTAGNGGSATTGTGTLQGGAGGSLAFSAGRGGAGTAAGVGGDITFSTTPTTAAQVERLRVTNSGYIGIGTGTTTSLPNARLTVVAENTTSSQIKLRSSRAALVANDVVGGLDFDTNDTNLTIPGSTSARIQALATATHTAAVTDTALVFSTSSGVTLAERWRIAPTGIFQGNGASNVQANAGNLTLSTLTSGNVIIDGAGTLEVQDNLNINSSQTTVGSSTVYTPQAIANAGSVAIGVSAATTVDVDSAFILTQTTIGTTKTLHTPTSALPGRVVYVTNSPSSTTTFTLYSVVIPIGGTQGYIWNGSAWTALNVATAGGGVTAMGLIDSLTKSSNGAVVSGTDLIMQTADGSNPGLVSTGTQTFAGDKTFTGTATFSSAGTGLSVSNDVTIGGLTTTNTLDVSGLTTLSGNLVANGSATGTTGTTSGTGTNTTTLTLSADAFNVNDVLYIDNVGQDYYTRVTVDGGTGTYTVSPAVSFDNARTVTRYTVQNIGATSTDYTSQSDRFFQGYFLGGVVVGAGSTTISDGSINSTTTLRIQSNGGDVTFGGGLTVTGVLTGDASGLTNIDSGSIDGATISDLSGTNITSGTVADARLSSNVTLLGNTFNGASQLVQLTAGGALPSLNGSALTSISGANISGALAAVDGSALTGLSAANLTGTLAALDGSALTALNGSQITTGTVADARLSTNVTVAGNTFNGTSQLVQTNVSGQLPALSGVNLTALNGTQITSGTVADARLSTNVTLLGNTFNGASQLVQLTAGGALPALNGSALTSLSSANLSGALPALSGASLTSLNGSNISSGTVADARLSTNVTLQGNTFNGVSQLVQLDGSGNLPVLNGSALTNISGANITGALASVDGSGLTNLTAANLTGALPAISGASLTSLNGSNISSGTVADARLSSNVTLAGNTFNGTSQLVQTNVSGQLPGLSGANLSALNGSQITTGTVADARLTTNVTLLGNTFNGASQLVQLTAGGALPGLNGSALTSITGGNISGALSAVSGANLTSLNGSNISSGTVADARLSTNVTLLGNTFNGASQLVQLTAGGALPALDGSALTSISGANITGALAAVDGSGLTNLTAANLTGALPALSGASLTSLNGSNISSGTVADARLSTNVTLLGNTFNGASQLVQLTAGGALPVLNGSALTSISGANISGALAAVDGSALTNLTSANLTGALPAISGASLTTLNGSNISSGTVADARLSGNVTLAGNTFNGTSQLVQTNVSGELPGLSGANLTALNGSQITTGTVADARLTTNVTLLGNTFNGASQLVQLTAGGALPGLNGSALTSITGGNISGALSAVSGANLTSLNASNVSSGTLADGRLSTNVALLDGGQTFSALTSFGSGLSITGTTNATGDIGATGEISGATVVGDGAGLTGLNASNIASGTVADGRLSANVALLNGGQTFSALTTFTNGVVLGQSTVTSAATVARAVSLPDEAGTICLSNKDTCGYLRLASGAAQTDASNNDVLAVNKTSATGNLINLQRSGTAVFTVANSGALQIQSTSSTALDIRNIGGTSYFSVDSSTGTVRVGSAVADGTGVLFVLDTKNTVGDPTGVNGASYYNSALNGTRCYEAGYWSDCSSTRLLGETTLGVAGNTITVNLAASTEYLQCRIDAKSRTGAAAVYLRFNGDTGAASYGWNTYSIIAAAVQDAQDSSDSELQLSGTDTGTTPVSANVNITNFLDTRKAVEWTLNEAEPIGANMSRYSGGGTWSNTASQISSVSFVTSANNFAAGSHAWCEGRNIR